MLIIKELHVMRKKLQKKFAGSKKKRYLCNPVTTEAHYNNAEIAQLVEHDLAKVGVASSSLVFRSERHQKWRLFSFHFGFSAP